MLTKLWCFALLILLLPMPARAEVVVWNFSGNVVACPFTPPLDTLVTCNGPLHGTLAFNDAAAPTSPGNWTLPGASFHAEIGNLVLDGTGATAWLWPNLDALLFAGLVDSSNVPGLDGQWRITIETYIDGFFDPNHLPATAPHSDPAREFWVDQSLAVWLVVPQGDGVASDVIGTDTQFGLTRFIPEPSPFAILIGLAAILISLHLLRGSRQD